MNVRFICIFNIYKLFLYNIDNKQSECGYNEKNIETNIVLNALIQFKNDKLKQDIYTEPIDELILKLNKIY